MPAVSTQPDLPIRLRPLHAFVAGVNVVLVLMLTVLASSAQAHAWFHTEADQADHACAVVMFAQGISSDATPVEVCAPGPAWQEPVLRPVAELCLSTPRYLRLPGRGPPDAA